MCLSKNQTRIFLERQKIMGFKYRKNPIEMLLYNEWYTQKEKWHDVKTNVGKDLLLEMHITIEAKYDGNKQNTKLHTPKLSLQQKWVSTTF